MLLIFCGKYLLLLILDKEGKRSKVFGVKNVRDYGLHECQISCVTYGPVCFGYF
jgi:hypothetical protein